mmetsp:Transcript_43843/g.58117  ORF Transcript_43843/g.58117 Transcript_43843/m.58117 type:complete len:82 (-) Transcript_43843:1060-1305(-)
MVTTFKGLDIEELKPRAAGLASKPPESIFAPDLDFLKSEVESALKPSEIAAAADEGESWRETHLLGDCVWFILRFAKVFAA